MGIPFFPTTFLKTFNVHFSTTHHVVSTPGATWKSLNLTKGRKTSPPSPGIKLTVMKKSCFPRHFFPWGDVVVEVCFFFLGGWFFLRGGGVSWGGCFWDFCWGLFEMFLGVFWAFWGVGESFSAVFRGICLKTAPHFVWS